MILRGLRLRIPSLLKGFSNLITKIVPRTDLSIPWKAKGKPPKRALGIEKHHCTHPSIPLEPIPALLPPHQRQQHAPSPILQTETHVFSIVTHTPTPPLQSAKEPTQDPLPTYLSPNTFIRPKKERTR